MDLLDQSSSEGEAEQEGFSINKNYAERYVEMLKNYKYRTFSWWILLWLIRWLKRQLTNFWPVKVCKKQEITTVQISSKSTSNLGCYLFSRHAYYCICAKVRGVAGEGGDAAA